MNYLKIYNNLIKKRQSEILTNVYYETHHILPKSMGGDNSKDNLVRLTAREHYIAHWLLMRIYKNKEMIYAFNMICNSKNSNFKKINSRAYSELRKIHSIEVSRHHKNKTLSDDTRKKISLSRKGKKFPNLSESKKGKNKKEEFKQYMKIKLSSKEKYTFYKENDFFYGTPLEFREKYNYSKSVVNSLCNGSRLTYKGWRITKDKKQTHTNLIDNTIYSLINKDGHILKCTQRELREKYNILIYHLLKGLRKSCKGYSLIKQ